MKKRRKKNEIKEQERTKNRTEMTFTKEVKYFNTNVMIRKRKKEGKEK